MNEVLTILYSAAAAYFVLFIISKLLGKKQIAELDFIDYATGISIGSIAAEMATDLERPFYYFIISMVIFFLFDIIVTLLSRKANFFKNFLRGKPLVIISQGKLDFNALKKSKIDFYDLLGLARSKGYFDLEEIEYAIFETNGELSILATDEKRAVKKEDFDNIKDSEPSLTNYLIVDGEISKYGLNETKKDKAWVLEEVKKSKLSLKQIMYAKYDDKTDKLVISKK